MSDETTEATTPTAEELQAQLAERDAAFNPLKEELAALKAQLAERNLETEKAKLIAANPDIPAELIAGDTPEALAASVAVARATVDRVRQHIAAQVSVPAGTSTAPAVDPFTLPPEQRIAYGMEHADEIVRTNILPSERNERR